MNTIDHLRAVSRRHFLQETSAGLGLMWLAAQGRADSPTPRDSAQPLAARAPHFAAKAKRVIFLHMAGAPSQLELFHYRPELARLDGKECPKEFVEGKRFAFIRGTPKLLGPVYPFHQEKKTGLWMSDRLPHLEKQMDKLCFIHTMQTDQFNHAPAQLMVQTGNQGLGNASLGAWVTYGLGTEEQNLPGFVVLLSGGHLPDAGKAAWGAGYLPSVYQGVQCRTAGEPVLYLNNPPGIDPLLRGKVVGTVGRMNGRTHAATGDPETEARISQYELAYRMQTSASDAFDLTRETKTTLDDYGAMPGRESFANNCLLARRLAERGVRFVQLFDWGWDSHGASGDEALNRGFKAKCESVDRPIAALLADLERTGLLKDTLVVWGSEFGRTPMRENRGGQEMALVGRDHHPTAFSMWMAGAGVKHGFSCGETDPFGYAPTGKAVQVRDLHATLLHLLGFDHKKLIYPFQGLDQKLTGVRPAVVVDALLS